MSKGSIVGLGIVGVIILLVIAVFGWCVSTFNTEIQLANRFDAQFNVVETTLDTMRKTIMNQHNCTKEWADKFIAVVMAQASGRSGVVAGGVEAGPNVKNAAVAAAVAGGGVGINVSRESEALGRAPALYQTRANSIEGQLAAFKRSQDVLTDVWREHKTFCQKFPATLMVGGKIKPKPEMISSELTKEAMVTKKVADDLLK
jgi:hypothetical protein